MSDRPTTRVQQARGFTLIELMIAAAIVGILASIAVPSYGVFLCKSKQSEAKTNLAAIFTAEEAYRTEHDTYVGGELADLSILGVAIIGPRTQYTYSVTTDDPVKSRNFTSFASGIRSMSGDLIEGSNSSLVTTVVDSCRVQ